MKTSTARSIASSVLVGVTGLITLCGTMTLVWYIASVPAHITIPSPKQTQQNASGFEKRVRSLGSTIISKIHLQSEDVSPHAHIAVVIENHQDARPHHAGLQDAQFIVEFLVEGLISRFVAVYDTQKLPEVLGPIRSLRPYMVDLMAPWTPLIIHAGGSPNALESVRNNPTVSSVNALNFDEGEAFERIHEIPAPHNLFIRQQQLGGLIAAQALSPKDDQFLETGTLKSGSSATIITIDFRNPTHNVRFEYDPVRSLYRRQNGDLWSAALSRNIVIVEMPITFIGEFGRLTIRTIGEGPALVFRNGKAITGKWKRGENEAMHLFDENGEIIPLTNGTTWISVIEKMERVEWYEQTDEEN